MFDTGGMAQLSRATTLITEAATAITPEMTGPQAGEGVAGGDRRRAAADVDDLDQLCVRTSRRYSDRSP